MTMRKAEDIQTEFTVLDQHDIRQSLKTIDIHQGKETLGVYLSPDGNNDNTTKVLKKKAEVWRDNIKTGHVDRNNAWLAVETTIMKSLEYPLPALTLTQNQCKEIMKPVLQAALAKSSLIKNFPRAVLYGPKQEGGLQLNDLYTSQGLSHIQKFQQHIDKPSITGKLIRVSMETAILEVGIGRNIFNLNYNKFGLLLSECWIKSIWRYCSENNIMIDHKTGSFLDLH